MVKMLLGKQNIKLTSEHFDKLYYKLFPLNRELVTFKIGRYEKRFKKRKMELDKEFYVLDNREQLLRYPINFKGDLLYFLSEEELETELEDRYEGKDIEIETVHGFELRDYQHFYINTALDFYYSGKNNVLINLKTGGGKTVIAMEIASKIGKRFGILILPVYIDKWIKDVTTLTNIKEDEIFVVQGSKSLLTLMNMTEEDLNKYKVIVFSLKTIMNYLKNWLNVDEEFYYPIKPDDLMQYLGIEFLINDETHQEFHNVFKSLLFFDVNFFIGLTATLVSSNKRLNKMYSLLFPEKHRLQNLLTKRYINVVAISYRFRNPNNIRVTKGYGYSQAVFENWILARSDVLERYLEMIYRIINVYYLNRREKGDKALIFAGTIEMDKRITEYLRKKIPNLKINKYTGEDDFSVIEESDIIVSTIQSSGTAIDIKNLITVLHTIPIESIQANKQNIGRLREIEGKEVYFVYVYSPDIKQHKRYHKQRIEYFSDIAKDFQHINYKELL